MNAPPPGHSHHIDIHDPRFTANPYDDYAELHRNCPDMHSLLYGKFWHLSRYDDVKSAALDWKSYTLSVVGVTAIPIITSRTEPQLPIELDPPLHSRYRALMAAVFSPARVEQLRPRILTLARNAAPIYVSVPRSHGWN